MSAIQLVLDFEAAGVEPPPCCARCERALTAPARRQQKKLCAPCAEARTLEPRAQTHWLQVRKPARGHATDRS